MNAAVENETTENTETEATEVKTADQQTTKAVDESENNSDNISCCGSCSD